MGLLAGILVLFLALLFLDDMEFTAVSLIIAIPLAVTYQLTDSVALAALTTFAILMVLGLLYRYRAAALQMRK
ncbi:hypothetical protein [uncultured Selenomonas sp.]|uniref:hypothetical protein n=1 Tax=uncultured Selenomonas sp. TaxID=159275 RepID=UPI0028DC2FB3|nr:hypothetical protein [uncultured Selenomonas sp.]